MLNATKGENTRRQQQNWQLGGRANAKEFWKEIKPRNRTEGVHDRENWR